MINEITLKKTLFQPFPAYSDRAAWDSISSDIKAFYLSEAAKRNGMDWPSLPATIYLEFSRNGNRFNYDDMYRQRRYDLGILLIAECIEGNGKYLDDIINGVWLICEETTWIRPAHLDHGPFHKEIFYHNPETGEKTLYPEPPKGTYYRRRLHEPEDNTYIDLSVAETGSLLSWVYYFLGNAIAKEVPEVTRRIEQEVIRRILIPFTEQDELNWVGLKTNNWNNWNPWINCNVLAALLIFAPAFSRAEEGVNVSIKSINCFIEFYTEDGCCEEGPGYFCHACGSLLDFIEELSHVTDVSYLYDMPKIRNMASYIYKVYIGKEYYINYGDCSPRVTVPAGTLERAGKSMGDNALIAFASYLKENKYLSHRTISNYFFHIYSLFADFFTGFKENRSNDFKVPCIAWFPGIQLVTARANENKPKGFFFSAKGSHNGVSHNHNDVGNFYLYYDARPVIVDVGVEYYSKSSNTERYKIWTFRSSYHNVPTINNVEQFPGKEYCAREVSISGINGEDITTYHAGSIKISMDIAGAYPDTAMVNSYKRNFIFIPDSHLELTDTYSLKECSSPLILNFLCYEKPYIKGNKAELSGKVILEFDSSCFKMEVEEISLTDPIISNDWQKEHLYRLQLIKKDMDLNGVVYLKFTKK